MFLLAQEYQSYNTFTNKSVTFNKVLNSCHYIYTAQGSPFQCETVPQLQGRGNPVFLVLCVIPFSRILPHQI